MVKCNSRQGAKIFSDFLQLIGKKAEDFPVELVPIAEQDNGTPQALLVLDPALCQKRKEELARAVGGRPQGISRQEQAAPDHTNALGGMDHFLGCVQAELLRVKQSRLPCSLLLIRIDGKDGSFLQKTAVTLQAEIAGDHHLAPLDHATLALLLPGLNRNRALNQAGAIHQLLAAETMASVKIGLAVCLARAVPQAREFLDMAFRELQKAEQETGDIFYSFHNPDDDACQVTAEERAQLFSFLNSGKKE